MTRILQLFLVLLLATCCAQPSFAARKRFRATLSGSQEVPAIKTGATGKLRIIVYEKELSFELNVKGIKNPAGAHIHKGKKGENGPPVAGLFGGSKEGNFSGILAEGTITDKSLLGELQGKKVADLVRLLKTGNAYVNVQTGTFPDGEIRGQIK